MFSVELLCLNLFTLTDIQCDMYSFVVFTLLSPQLEVYKNPLYTESIQQVLFPSASIRKLELWKGYYLRWNPRMRPQVHSWKGGMDMYVIENYDSEWHYGMHQGHTACYCMM